MVFSCPLDLWTWLNTDGYPQGVWHLFTFGLLKCSRCHTKTAEKGSPGNVQVLLSTRFETLFYCNPFRIIALKSKQSPILKNVLEIQFWLVLMLFLDQLQASLEHILIEIWQNSLWVYTTLRLSSENRSLWTDCYCRMVQPLTAS